MLRTTYAAPVFIDTRFDPPRRQRVAAYAVICRGEADAREVLLSRLAPYLSVEERWTLPGGGIAFGEHPREAVVREVFEETGLHAEIGTRAWTDSATRVLRQERLEMQSVRMVFEGRVPEDSPEPRVVEIDGSTVDARWHRVVDVRSGRVVTVPMVTEALAQFTPWE